MLQGVISINRTVTERIAWAESCFHVYGDLFLEDERIAALLCEFETAAKVSKQRMDEIGVVALCRECDREEGGSCCGKGLENRYDAWLLLINKLLSVDFPRERRQVDGCFFLGERGCPVEGAACDLHQLHVQENYQQYSTLPHP